MFLKGIEAHSRFYECKLNSSVQTYKQLQTFAAYFVLHSKPQYKTHLASETKPFNSTLFWLCACFCFSSHLF